MGEIQNFRDIESDLNNKEDVDFIALSDEMIQDARTIVSGKRTMSLPIGELASLGGGVASLLPQLRTVTQTMTVNTDGLFRLVNAGSGDVLKVAKNGNFWGAMKTAEGKSKFTQWQQAGSLTADSVSVLPVNPAVMMVAVALFSLEQKLGEIEALQRDILSFLEIEKEAEIEADVQTLGNMIAQYKFNWDNELFAAGNHKMVLDIQRTARKHMNTYLKRVAEKVGKKASLISRSKVQQAEEELLKEFKYYRMSVFSFSLASLLEVLFGGNYSEEYILAVKKELDSIALEYRELFTESSKYLEKITGRSVEKNVLKGIGSASEAIGKAVGKIPIVEKGPVDEFLQSGGEKLKSSAERIESSILETFASVSNPGTGLFSEKLEEMRQIYNHTSELCFDDENIYLIAE